MSWKAEYAILILFTAINYLSTLLLARMKSRKLRGFTNRGPYSQLRRPVRIQVSRLPSQSLNLLIEKTNLANRCRSLTCCFRSGFPFTFQTLSYTIDVYNGRISRRRIWHAHAVCLFPQLVAGPIERSVAFAAIQVVHRFNIARATNGCA